MGPAPHSGTGVSLLVLFDWDGTLVDSRDVLVACWHAATTEVLGRRYPEAPDEYDTIFRLRGTEAFAAIASDQTEAVALDAAFQRAYRGHRMELYLGALETLRALREEGHEVGVVTSKTRERFEADALGTGTTECFDIVVCGDDVSSPKPHPEGLRKAMVERSFTPHRTLLVGDTSADTGAGLAAGLAVIGAGWGYGDASLRRDCSGGFADHIRDVPRLVAAYAARERGGSA